MKPILYLGVLLWQFTPLASLAADKLPAQSIKTPIDPLSGTNITQLVAGLLFVLFMVIAVAWLLRRVGGVNVTGNSALKVVAGMSMGARERVVLIQVGEKQVLVGVSPGRIQTLHVLETPIEDNPEKHSSINFSEKLAEVLRGRHK